MSSARPCGPESMKDDLSARARTIIDANLYMTLATADETGRPWASPVYFAHADYREFVWVSRPGATHSLNIAARPQVGIVIFDTHAPISTGGGMYMSATAEELAGGDRQAAIEVFSARSLAHGGEPFDLDDVEPPAVLRMYRATASEHWVLDSHDHRVAVDLLRGASGPAS
jgi:nitroimidazol reductase NimA-like FMN-containing flavoprotein (pyridoxamine 5'-phosphate oxidase superfamily)